MPNRFHRSDRVGDTNRISIGLESRMIESASGRQQLKAELAQMFYLSNRKVRQVRSAEPLTDRYSNLFGEVSINLTDVLSTSANVVWNWKDHQVSSSDIGLNYDNYRSRFGLSYGYDPGDAKEELAAEWIWPVSSQWLVGLESKMDVAFKFQQSILALIDLFSDQRIPYGVSWQGSIFLPEIHSAFQFSLIEVTIDLA